MPPIMKYHDNNKIRSKEYVDDHGKFHRENGPALTEWYKNGHKYLEGYLISHKFHRVDGPALTEWYSDGKIAAERYFVNGGYHREDGPAIIKWYSDGQIKDGQYWVNGKQISPEWFTQFGKDINNDFSDETIRSMILNIHGV